MVVLSHSEVHAFAGNCFELRNDKGELFLAISRRAWEVSDKNQQSKMSLPVAFSRRSITGEIAMRVEPKISALSLVEPL